ncbi:MAG: hypothetical protein LAT77_02805 [Aliidiomarina sp.]|uniref:hypothetical protein n=1 Tax=Aliidiomarina sp. TaxID=1872439 RepID=UPI0025BEA80F|nr:hypothetical protein [Aliidiomarina sp.]MCH8500823.1 hypothetical protein [Aliidiomarina sp.]
MRKIILTALSCALLAVFFGWLVTAQANASSSNDSASLLIALVSIPLVLASAVFSVGAGWVLRTSERRHEHKINSPMWLLAYVLNVLLAVGYILGLLYIIILIVR